MINIVDFDLKINDTPTKDLETTSLFVLSRC
jgi:hypothetical protein